MQRRIWGFVIILICSLGTPKTMHATAMDMCVEQPLTCIGEPFKDIWLKNNGPENFGIPLGPMTSQIIDGTHFMRQEFERTRMEYFPRRVAPNNIVIGRVGAEWLDVNINKLMPLPTYHHDMFDVNHAHCRTVRAGSPAVCGPFLTYYEQNGVHIDALPYVHAAERHARYGLPLTPAMQMNQDGEMRIVQVFERARLEWYPDDAYGKVVKIGPVVAEMINAQQARPIQPSSHVNQLVITNQSVLPFDEYGRWRWGWPKVGYWDTVQDDIYVATSTIVYLDEFWSVRAPDGYRFVSLTVLIQNRRASTQAPVYVDYSYFALIDHTGMRAPAHPLAQRLVLPVQPVTITPQGYTVGQLVFLLPNSTVPAQLEINLANLDETTSRFVQYIELRAYPKS